MITNTFSKGGTAPQAKIFRTQTKGAEIVGLSSSTCTNGGYRPLEIDPPLQPQPEINEGGVYFLGTPLIALLSGGLRFFGEKV